MAVRFISEVSSNHYQDLNRCFQFIDTSAQIGCDGVKFQLFKVDELFSPEVFRTKPEVEKRRQWELPVDFLPKLADRCRIRKMLFGVTPFYLRAVDELYPYVDFYKIASYELIWSDLLQACAQTGKPVVLSTGMATLDEVQQATDTLRNAGCQDFKLLHCISSYPTPAVECNLAAIQTLRETCHIPVGWSDHSVIPGVIFRAVHKWGAEIVEFHLDLDGRGEEFSAGHCWLPEQIQVVIEAVRIGFQADGNGYKEPASSELPDRDWRADPNDGLRPVRSMRNKLE